MPKDRRAVERVVDAARDVTGWLELLGSNCCAGRSYRRIDDLKGGSDREATEAEGAAGPSPAGLTPRS
jgi:hypothetical protein